MLSAVPAAVFSCELADEVVQSDRLPAFFAYLAREGVCVTRWWWASVEDALRNGRLSRLVP